MIPPWAVALLGMAVAASVVARWWHAPPRRPRPWPNTIGADDGPHTVVSRSSSAPRTVTLDRSVLGVGAVGVAVLTVVFITEPVLGLGAGVVVAVVLSRRGRRSATRLRARREAALPELMDALVALVHAGLTPPMAWRELLLGCPADLRDPIAAVCHRMDRGDPFADALGQLLVDIGPGAHVLVDTLVTAERYGLPLGPVLERLSAEAAAQRRRSIEARSRQLPVRLSFPLVLCTLPSFVLLAIVPVLVTALSSLPRP